MVQFDLENIFNFPSLKEAAAEFSATCLKSVDAQETLQSSSLCRSFNAVRRFVSSQRLRNPAAARRPTPLCFEGVD